MNSVKVIAALLILSTFFNSRAISMEKAHLTSQNLSLPGNHVLSGIIPIPVNDAHKLVSPENLMDAPYLFQSAQTFKKKLDSLITLTWNTTENKWTGEGNQRYEYDDKGRLIKYIWSKKDVYADKWDDSYKEEYTYENDNLIRHIDFYRDTITGALILDNKVEYIFDSNRNMIQYTSYEWQVSSGLWIASAKADLSYNTNGKVTQYLSYYYNTSTGLWISSYKGEYSYNSSGKPTLYTGYSYGGSPGNWVADYKGEFSYDTGGRIEQYIDYYWNSSTKQWVAIGKDEFSYDANGFLVRTTEYYYDALTRRYVSERKQEYNYDVNSNISQYTEFYFNQTGGGWTYTFKEEYTYNNDYAYDDLIVPVIYKESNRLSFNHMRLSANSYLWDEISATWKNHKSNSFWYSSFYPEKDVPDAVDDQFFVSNDTILIANVSLNDRASKNDPNSWELLTTNGPFHGRLTSWDISAGAFTYEPDSGYVGEDWFYYRLCDGDNDCDTAKVSITVLKPNDYPIAVNDTFQVYQDMKLDGDVSINDTPSSDGGNIWSMLTPPVNGIAVLNADGKLSYTPNPGYWGRDSLVYRVCDIDNDCDTAKVIITIFEVNTPPYIIKNIPDYEVNAGKTLAIFISSTPGELFGDDNTGDSLTITVSLADGVPLPSFMSFKDDTLFVKPLDTDIGCYTIFVKATDLKGAFVNLSFEICAKSSTTGIMAEINELFDVSVYPNPSKGNVIIDLSHNPGEPLLLQVINAGGQIVKQQILVNHHTMVDLTGHPAEIYLFRILNRKSAITKKIIIY